MCCSAGRCVAVSLRAPSQLEFLAEMLSLPRRLAEMSHNICEKWLRWRLKVACQFAGQMAHDTGALVSFLAKTAGARTGKTLVSAIANWQDTFERHRSQCLCWRRQMLRQVDRKKPPPRGGVLFTMFPDLEPCVRDFTTRCDGRISS